MSSKILFREHRSIARGRNFYNFLGLFEIENRARSSGNDALYVS
ncbi:MAG: hypothetical protein ACFFAS_09460 [Promethearchaeota archaeon]